MTLESVKVNANLVVQRFASLGSQTMDGIKAAASGTVNGVKALTSPVAHGALHVTAETADLVAKSALIIGPVVAVVLIVDSIMFANTPRPTWFFNSCGENVPLLCSHKGELAKLGEQGRLIDGTMKCIGAPNPGEFKAIAAWQGLVGLAVLTAVPIAALTFRKINQLVIKLNSSF